MAGPPVELLQRVALFADLNKRELRQIASSMKERTYAPGEEVVTEGQGGAGFFVIGEGRASVHVHGEEKDALGPGDHFGEIAIVADVPRMATVRAETALRCYGLTSWQFRPLVETNAAIAWKVLQAMGKALASRA